MSYPLRDKKAKAKTTAEPKTEGEAFYWRALGAFDSPGKTKDGEDRPVDVAWRRASAKEGRRGNFSHLREKSSEPSTRFKPVNLKESDIIPICDMYASGSTIEECADKFRVSVATIYNVLTCKTWRHINREICVRSKVGAKMVSKHRPPNSKLSDADIHEIRRMHLAKFAIKEIAKKFGISDVTVGKVATGKNWSHVPQFGEKCTRRKGGKTNPEIVIEIRAKKANGASTIQLAKDYELGRRTIYAIVSRQSWKHVP